MYRPVFNRQTVLRFKHFMRKGYALFNCLGKVVVIGPLSAATLSHAQANGMSTMEAVAGDTVSHKEVRLDEIVVHGSRAPLTALQAAKIVTVVSREDIGRMSAESVNDVLKLATGVDVRQRGGFGVQTDISINGGTFDQITILLNGIDISSPQTGHNAADFPVSLSDIERIEVLEGAAARVFGGSAFNGAVNIVTRCDEETGVRISVSAGSYGTVEGDAGVTVRGKNVANQFSGGLTRSDGGTENSGFMRRRIFYQGNYNSRHAYVRWQGGVSSQDFGANTFYSSKYNNQYEETRRYMLSAQADIMPWGAGGLTVSPAFHWHRDMDHYQLTHGLEGADNGENYHRIDVYGGGINAHLPWALGKTAVGVDISRDHILSTVYGDLMEESEWKGIRGSGRKYDHKGSRTNTNVFAEHDVLIGSLTLSAGVLANKNTGLGGGFRFYPGVDISYRVAGGWKFYVSWNKALRVPTYTDLYTSNAAQQGDLDLKPEKIWTLKSGARYRNEWMTATVSGFYSNGKDIIDWVYETAESTTYHALNIGKLDNMGASADVTFNIGNIVARPLITRIKAGYAYIHQKHETEQAIYGSLYALEYLRHKAVLQVDHRLPGRLSASWVFRWQQRMNGYTPYTKIDAKITWAGGRWVLYVKADNLTGHRYYDLGGVKQPGLWIMAGGSVKLNII